MVNRDIKLSSTMLIETSSGIVFALTLNWKLQHFKHNLVFNYFH